MEANPEIKEAAMQEMMLVSQEMGTLLKANKIHFPKMFLSMFAQFPVFISLFLATRDVSVAPLCARTVVAMLKLFSCAVHSRCRMCSLSLDFWRDRDAVQSLDGLIPV